MTQICGNTRVINLLIVVASLTLYHTAAYPSGAPETVCQTMMPGHGFFPQSSSSPYGITVSGTTYQPGQALSVSVGITRGTVQFKGFLLEARLAADNSIVANFSNIPTTAQSLCSGGGLTHVSRDLKNSVTVTWSSTSVAGDFYFVLTVVQSFDTYWTNITSNTLSIGGAAATTEATTTGELLTSTTTTTTPTPPVPFQTASFPEVPEATTATPPPLLQTETEGQPPMTTAAEVVAATEINTGTVPAAAETGATQSILDMTTEMNEIPGESNSTMEYPPEIKVNCTVRGDTIDCSLHGERTAAHALIILFSLLLAAFYNFAFLH